MCRVYEKGGRQYVRLCYRTGRRGQHIYFEGEPPLTPGGHYRGVSVRDSANGLKRQPRFRRCACCGNPCGPDESLCGKCEYALRGEPEWAPFAATEEAHDE